MKNINRNKKGHDANFISSRAGAIPVAIIVLVLIVLGAVTTIGSAYLLSQRDTTAPEDSLASSGSNPFDEFGTEETASTSNQGKKPTPKPTRTPKPVGANKPPSNETGTTENGWTYSGYRDVIVDVVNNSTSNEVIIEFSRSDFSNIASIYYNFTYTDNDRDVKHGVESTIAPENETLIKTSTGYVVRKRVYLGVCSQGVCTPHTSMSDFELAVTSTRDNKKSYDQLLTKSAL